MKHILFISHARGTHGAERVMTEAIRACRQAGARITVVVPSIVADEGLDALLNTMQVKVLALPYRAAGKHALRTLLVRAYNLRALRTLSRYVKKEHVDTIYSNSSVTVIGADLAQRTRVRHIWHWHESVNPLYGWHPSLRSLYRRMAQEAHVLFISRRQQEEWTKALGTVLAGTIVYNPIRSLAIPKKEVHEGLRIGYIGRWETRKNIPMLLRVFARFHRINPQSELWICGAANEAERHLWERTYEQEGVSFLLHTEDVAMRYRQLDILAIPSLSESWGLVAVEAMQAGIAVLCTDQSGLNECYTDGVDCFLLPPTDEQAWVDALVLYSDATVRTKMAKHGQETTKQLAFNTRFDQQIQTIVCAS